MTPDISMQQLGHAPGRTLLCSAVPMSLTNSARLEYRRLTSTSRSGLTRSSCKHVATGQSALEPKWEPGR